MGAGNVARAQYDGLATKLLKIRRFGTECYRFGAVPREALGHLYQFGIGGLLERWHLGNSGA